MTTNQPSTAAAPAQDAPGGAKTRILSIDAFRGTVMTLMLAEVLHLPSLARAFPNSLLWGMVAFHTSHVEWQGCSLHDLIQPGFSFLVGAALPFSIAKRRASGQPFGRLLAHAVLRAFILVALGVVLRSIGRPQTYFTFEDTLSQIGLGYAFLFLLGFARVRTQVIALALILVGYWALFAFWPAPAGFDYPGAGVPQNWPLHYTGFLSHWNKNSNPAWAFDVWFLNLFPREKPFAYNGGGYSTLSFIPTLGTMILGLLAGGWLKSARQPLLKLKGLLGGGAALLLAGLLCQWTGVCPIVKRIWTPAFTLYSGGWVVLILAALYALMEVRGWRRWAFPLLVVGMNSIAIYVMSWTMEGFFSAMVRRHLPAGLFTLAGPAFEPVIQGLLVMLLFWLILWWMARNRIFLRI